MLCSLSTKSFISLLKVKMTSPLVSSNHICCCGVLWRDRMNRMCWGAQCACGVNGADDDVQLQELLAHRQANLHSAAGTKKIFSRLQTNSSHTISLTRISLAGLQSLTSSNEMVEPVAWFSGRFIYEFSLWIKRSSFSSSRTWKLRKMNPPPPPAAYVSIHIVGQTSTFSKAKSLGRESNGTCHSGSIHPTMSRSWPVQPQKVFLATKPPVWCHVAPCPSPDDFAIVALRDFLTDIRLDQNHCQRPEASCPGCNFIRMTAAE